ncbi:MAG: ATP-binding protein [Qingshengfaniella sp.]
MLPFNLLVVVCLAYAVLLFGIAFAVERRAQRGAAGWLCSPWIYTLSLSIYCTAWTFYGAVGYAARSGLEYLTIYIGPVLVLVGWIWIVRKLVHVGRAQRITSVADLISARYGKSAVLGGLVTLMAVVGMTPYIALQLQSVTLSFGAFAHGPVEPGPETIPGNTALWVAIGLAIFSILFGTRNLDANERHHGVVIAIAIEALVKLAALVAVGVFVVWGLGQGPAAMLARIDASPIAAIPSDSSRWMTLIFVSAAAFLCLPRMFQVLVVENDDQRHLMTASWAFPLYLAAMSLFVVPIAVIGLDLLPEGSNPDLFVLSLPLAMDRDALAMLVFLGGFSSATSMVVVAAIALSTMMSNHIVMPVWLAAQGRGRRMSGDVRHVVIVSRRLSIAAVMAFGYVYYDFSSEGTALSAIGTISFVAVAQALPALMGAIFWRGATRVGAGLGLSIGFGLWLYTLFLPSFGADVLIPREILTEGPWGLGWLRPHALFGLSGIDPVVHSVLWSLSTNTLAFVVGSIFSLPTPLERLQGAQFVNVTDYSASRRDWRGGAAETEDLLVMAQRILGPAEAQALFRKQAEAQGIAGYLPDATPGFVDHLERRLAGSVGAAAAHAMVGQIMRGAGVTVQELLAVADETAQIMEYSSQLKAKGDELARTARQLREANEKLTALSVQKDVFLNQISHELRTPMTSIRAFSEILMGQVPVPVADRVRYTRIIHDEALRLTRLLDALLDLSVLEHGHVRPEVACVPLCQVIDRAVDASYAQAGPARLRILRDRPSEEITILTDFDRLSQVFINLIANARKYCDAADPRLDIRVESGVQGVTVDFIDNGSGIALSQHNLIFEKFSRLNENSRAGGAGLGLAICREIMEKLGGTVSYLPGQSGGAFRVSLPADAVQDLV